MQIAAGQRHHAVRSFATLSEMLHQSVDLYGDKTAFVFRHKPNDPVQARTRRLFLTDVNTLVTALTSLSLPNRRCCSKVTGDFREHGLIRMYWQRIFLPPAQPLSQKASCSARRICAAASAASETFCPCARPTAVGLNCGRTCCEAFPCRL